MSRVLKLFVVALVVVILSASLKSPVAAAGGLTAAWVTQGEKITRDDLRVSGDGRSPINAIYDGNTVRLSAARNETVDFMLILEALHGASDVGVSFKSLVGPGGITISSIPASGDAVFRFVGRDIELFKLDYLQIKGVSRLNYEDYDQRHVPRPFRRPYTGQGHGYGGWSDRPDHDKFYPEIAIPLELTPTFSIPVASSQMIFADIWINRNAAPGLYRGEVTVSEGGTVTRVIPVELEVYDFTLPDEPSLKTMLYFSSSDINKRFFGTSYVKASSPEGQQARLLRDLLVQMFHRHGISMIGDDSVNDCDSSADRPCPEWTARLNGTLFTHANGYSGYGENVGNNIYVIGVYGSLTDRLSDQASVNLHTDAWISWFDQNAPASTEVIWYIIDESPDTEFIERTARMFLNNPGPGRRVRSMATVRLPTAARDTPSLDHAYSTIGLGIESEWKPLVVRYNADSRHQANFYNTHRPGSGTTATEDYGVALRQLAWVQFRLRIPRWFQWQATYWNNFQGGMGETNVFESAATFGTCRTFHPVFGLTGWNCTNGDGVLAFPATDKVYPQVSFGLNGFFMSLRAKIWRRGLHDGHYLALANRINPQAVRAIVDRMVPKALYEYGVTSLEDPTWVRSEVLLPEDPDAWEEARRELAAIIVGHHPPANQPPVATMTTTHDGLTVTVNGSASHDPDGSISSSTVLWGDGSESAGLTATHSYAQAGSYVVTLRVADDDGASAQSQAYVTVSLPPAPGSVTRVEESDPAWTFSGDWIVNASAPHSGDRAKLALAAGARATLTFSGTRAVWIAYRDDWAGTARVYIDNVYQATIDTYVNAYLKQVVMYTTPSLANGPHTLTIEATGLKNSASRGSAVWVDAADVLTEGQAVPDQTAWIRFEETDHALMFTGDWIANGSAPHSSGTAKLAQALGARVTFRFNGTAVRWIAYRDPWCGVARVYVDGVLHGEVDTYASDYLKQRIMYTIENLEPGDHEVIIEVAGQKNPQARAAYVWVDALDVRGHSR
jgi:PKD repeat protein